MALYDCVWLELQIDQIDTFKHLIGENIGGIVGTYYKYLSHILLFHTEHWQGNSWEDLLDSAIQELGLIPIYWNKKFFFVFSNNWAHGNAKFDEVKFVPTLALLQLPIDYDGGLWFNCAERLCNAYLVYYGKWSNGPSFFFEDYTMHRCTFVGGQKPEDKYRFLLYGPTILDDEPNEFHDNLIVWAWELRGGKFRGLSEYLNRCLYNFHAVELDYDGDLNRLWG